MTIYITIHQSKNIWANSTKCWKSHQMENTKPTVSNLSNYRLKQKVNHNNNREQDHREIHAINQTLLCHKIPQPRKQLTLAPKK